MALARSDSSIGVAFVPHAPAGADDERNDWIGPFLIEKRHPLLSGVTLEGVIWSASPTFARSGSPLVSAGNRPLLVEEREDGRRVFHANIDPLRSTLVRSPDWPILLANLAEMARDELPGPDRTSLATGEPFWTPHAAFVDPTAGPAAPPRQSVELRAICLLLG